MNSKAILGISIAAVFAVTMIFAENANASGHTSVASFDSASGAGMLAVEIVAGGTIPLDGSSAFGYGVITDADTLDNVLALTTHKCAADHFLQSQVKDGSCAKTVGLLNFLNLGTNAHHNGEEVHAHVLDLIAVDEDSACFGTSSGDAVVEVDLASSLGNRDVIAFYTIEVDDDTIRTAAPVSQLEDDSIDAVAYFGIAPKVAPNGDITNLCLTDVSLNTGDD